MRVGKPATKTIGSYTYVALPLPSSVALEVQRRLLAVLGGGLGGASLENLVPAIGSVLKSLSAEDQDYVIRVCVKEVQVRDGALERPLMDGFEEHFRGYHHELLQLLAFVLEVTFSGTLKELVGKLDKAGLGVALASVLSSQKAASGSSTG